MDEEIRKALTDRLHVLELRRAQLGFETPPAIVNEIEDIIKQLRSDGSSKPIRTILSPPPVDDLFQMIIDTNNRANTAFRVTDLRVLKAEETIARLLRWQHILTIVLATMIGLLVIFGVFAAGLSL